jgi:hypothetical protein
MAERVRDATQRSERLLEGLLTLTRSEREPSRREPADLADAATQALQHGRHAHTAGLLVVTRLEPAPVAGDPALLDRMVANLIENAMRHNRPNGWSPPAPIAGGRSCGSPTAAVPSPRPGRVAVRAVPPPGRPGRLIRRRHRPGPVDRALGRPHPRRRHPRPGAPRRRPGGHRAAPSPRQDHHGHPTITGRVARRTLSHAVHRDTRPGSWLAN